MRVLDIIRTKLEQAFQPEHLSVVDESHLHAGHSGARPGGETHFRVTLVSSAFSGMSRVDRQRRVHAVLDEELKQSVHALALSVKSTDEVT
jgi:BolA protein